jgi:hypothetical protein
MIFGGIISVLGTLATTALQAYNKSKDVTIEAFKASGAIASAQAQAMSAWIGHPLSPPSIMCYAIAIWFFKAVAIDNVLCPAVGWECSTPALRGGTAELAWIVASGMFFSGIANIMRGR